jgi:hypothetical protein
MRTIPLQLSGDDESIIGAIEAACRRAGLTMATKGTLHTYPGSVHWHFKKGANLGTLEATYVPRDGRAWFSVQGGREAPWIDQVLPGILRALDQR